MLFFSVFLCIFLPFIVSQRTEIHRPQFHFSPATGWMNDPNGLVFHNGTYHLFYQHNPENNTFGPIHWGHATSQDLVRWNEEPLALFPNELGYIFSGSAVADTDNTSGLGSDGKIPLIAIFTQHDKNKGDSKPPLPAQTQGIAYSLDNGRNWTMYPGNPVIPNNQTMDFRDPKVFWFEADEKWVMLLAVGDRIEFWSSRNLLNWEKDGEFGGKGIGAHGGVWECPDLLLFFHEEAFHWILLVSINPGGPNNGSATQYFVGNYDGKTFLPAGDVVEKWMDYGTDNYAGVTWSNVENRKLLISWMSNWIYADKVPTAPWRGTQSVPRDLGLKTVNGQIYLTSLPVPELTALSESSRILTDLTVDGQLDVSPDFGRSSSRYRLRISLKETADWSLVFSNGLSEELVVGFETTENRYLIDRRKARNGTIGGGHEGVQHGPRISLDSKMDVTLFVDVASVEVFADGGLTCMTAIFFPTENYNKLALRTPGKLNVAKMELAKLKSIWK